MSPEQLEGQPVNGASDQFALGIVVYELLCGKKPFVAENLPALHYLICKRPAPPVHEVNVTLNETVDRVMERALAKLPEDRYNSCGEFIGALSLVLAECPDWVPVAPPKLKELEAGNGWYAPETLISAGRGDDVPEEEPLALTPVVLPPPVQPGVALYQEFDAEDEERPREMRRSDGTRFRVERPAARRMGWMMAACGLVALLGVLIIHSLRQPVTSASDYKPRVIVPGASPENLSVSRQSVPPADLTTDQQATSAAAKTVIEPEAAGPQQTTSTTVAVRTPSARPAETPPPVAEHLVTTARSVQPAPPPLVKAALPTPAPSSDVELVSDPPGARVVVDGSSGLSCLSPCTLPLARGRHALFAELGGYGTTRKIFNAPVDGSVFISLMKNTGMLILTSEPTGTVVSLDGQNIGPTPVKIKLAAGKHHLSLSDGARHHDETIMIDTDGVYARSFRW